MSTPVKAIGIREFRENIAGYADSETPMAITRHGMTLGYYIPVKRSPTEADKLALQEATQRLHHLLEEQGIDPEDLISDFKALRKQRKRG
jgi:hypothetical protein